MDLNILGLCHRAKKLELGYARSIDAVKKGKAKLVITAGTLSVKTLKEVCFFCDKFNCKLINTDYSIEQLSQAIGFNAGVVAVTDKGFADKLSSTTNR